MTLNDSKKQFIAVHHGQRTRDIHDKRRMRIQFCSYEIDELQVNIVLELTFAGFIKT